jgi:hypothetical protein
MRLMLVAALLATAGCTEFGLVLRPGPDFVGLETWTGVRPGQVSAQAKVGEVLHLPVCSVAGTSDPPGAAQVSSLRVTVNGVPIDGPEYHTSSTTISHVFRAEQAGTYRVEVTQPPAKDPIRVWNITVSP